MCEELAKCGTCWALLDEEDLFCANCGTEAPQRADTVPSQTPGHQTKTSTHNFQCHGCGASMSYDASAGSLRCPFCGCEQLEPQADSKTLAAERVVPFAHRQHDAVSSMQQWLGRGFWRPGDLAKNAVVVDMTAVYVPYWVFRGWTKTNWTADTSQTPIGARGDWFPMTGEHHSSHEGLLVGASGALTPAETAEICPFDMGRASSPEGVDLDNVTVERFNVPRKYARLIARRGMEQRDAQACDAQYVPQHAGRRDVERAGAAAGMDHGLSIP